MNALTLSASGSCSRDGSRKSLASVSGGMLSKLPGRFPLAGSSANHLNMSHQESACPCSSHAALGCHTVVPLLAAQHQQLLITTAAQNNSAA